VTTRQLLEIAWEPEPSILVGCFLLLAVYLLSVRFRFNRETVMYTLGVVVLLLTLIGPLDFLGDDYLFSAHMLEHLVLILIVPPLLIMGLGVTLAKKIVAPRWIADTERTLRRPALAWFLGMGTMWVWHLPGLYNAALHSEKIHIIEHLTMLVSGTIFWWPVLSPLPRSRLAPLSAVIYIFLGGMANMVLGIILTFSGLGAYPKYMRSSDGTGIFRLIREGWGLDPKADLQLGGLFMWILGGFVFLWAIMVVLSWFYRMSESDSLDLS
jgi:cytochrome c oxidase assembly factor CtaG